MLAVALLASVALLNLVPVIVTFAPSRAVTLYELDEASMRDPVTRVLMRHRGALFAIVSLWLLAGAWSPAVRGLAIASAVLAKLAFLAVYASEPAARRSLARVAAADAFALVLLAAAWAVTDSAA